MLRMGLFVDVLLQLSAYANKKTLAIMMTYLYIMTVIILIFSYIKLAKDDLLKDDSIDRYLSRHVNGDYDEIINNVLINDDTMNGKHGLDKPEVHILVKQEVHGLVKPETQRLVKPEVHGLVKSETQRLVKPEVHGFVKPEVKGMVKLQAQGLIKPEVAIKQNGANSEKNNHANLKAIEKRDIAVVKEKKKIEQKTPKIKKIQTKYPNIEIVENFVFDNNPKATDEYWQNVTKDGTFLVFSSFLDHINGQPNVRTLGMNGNTFLPKFYCELTYANDVILTLKGRIWMLPDHHEMDYKSVFLYCPLPDDNQPLFLSIIPINEPARLHKLPIMHHPKELRNFTVCLAPLFFNYSIEHELVQWIELNKLLGADMFYIYNYSTVGRTDEILYHYQREGSVKVIQWVPPSYADIHYKGQIAMTNDCFFKNYRVSRYLVYVDLDEFIVPRKNMQTWNQLVTSFPHDACEYSFRSSFLTESKNVFEGKQKARELHLEVILRQSRREYIFDKNVRSKYIVNTTCIDTVGIHYCWKYRNGTAATQRHYVPPRDSLMYHMRMEPVAKKGKEVEEKAIYKYHTQLIDNVRKRWEKIDIEAKSGKKNVIAAKRIT